MFNEVYNDWNHKRAKAIIDHYGYRFFYGKKVLDLGAGLGDIAASLSRLGADVTCVDVRQENLDIIAKKHPHLRTMKVDLDYDWPFIRGQYDVVLSLGLLCHLRDCSAHIKNICSVAEHVILETEVLDSSDFNLRISIFEDKAVNDLSFHGEGSLVNTENIQNRLSEAGAKFKRADDPKMNSGPYRYNWQNSNAGRVFGNRRLWFVRLDKFIAQKLENQRLTAEAEKAIFAPPFLQPEIRHSYSYQLDRKSIDNMEYFVHTAKINNKSEGKIRLFYNYYEDPDPTRQEEINYCLKKNLENNNFDVIILESNTPPTFDFFFQKINIISGPDDINIICNADIYFDESISLARNISHKEVYALNSWDWITPEHVVFKDNLDNQDVWIIRGRIENVFGGFQIGKQAYDNRIAFEFLKAGFKVFNPSQSIKTYHRHTSGIRRHFIREFVPGPYLFILPTEITG